jgi:hypothetical protein
MTPDPRPRWFWMRPPIGPDSHPPMRPASQIASAVCHRVLELWRPISEKSPAHGQRDTDVMRMCAATRAAIDLGHNACNWLDLD